jgi:hypothetical protein
MGVLLVKWKRASGIAERERRNILTSLLGGSVPAALMAVILAVTAARYRAIKRECPSPV